MRIKLFIIITKVIDIIKSSNKNNNNDNDDDLTDIK